MKWFLVLMVLVGDYLVVRKNRNGFLIWILVDGFFSFQNFFESDYVQSSIFALYALMGFYGYFAWKSGR